MLRPELLMSDCTGLDAKRVDQSTKSKLYLSPKPVFGGCWTRFQAATDFEDELVPSNYLLHPLNAGNLSHSTWRDSWATCEAPAPARRDLCNC